MKRIFFILIVLVIFINCMPEQISIIEQPEPGENTSWIIEEKYDEYTYYKTIWENEKIDSYEIEIYYRAFSPYSGTWVITIEEGELVSSRRNGEEEEFYIDVDFLFEEASNYYIGRDIQLYIYEVDFSDEYGIDYIKKIENTECDVEPPTDGTYIYKILNFRIL